MLEHPITVVYKHPFCSMDSFDHGNSGKYIILMNNCYIHEVTYHCNEDVFFLMDGKTTISFKDVYGWAKDSLVIQPRDYL